MYIISCLALCCNLLIVACCTRVRRLSYSFLFLIYTPNSVMLRCLLSHILLRDNSSSSSPYAISSATYPYLDISLEFCVYWILDLRPVLGIFFSSTSCVFTSFDRLCVLTNQQPSLICIVTSAENIIFLPIVPFELNGSYEAFGQYWHNCFNPPPGPRRFNCPPLTNDLQANRLFTI